MANTGPGLNSKSRSRWLKIERPVTSVGCRSGVHWIREETRALDRLRDRPGEHRLRRARHVLEQHVASADEGGDDERDLVALAVHDRLDVVEQPARNRVRLAVRLDCQPGLPSRTTLAGA